MSIRVDRNNLKDHFQINDSMYSVTKTTSFVLSHVLGNKQRRRIMLIDSPGFFDPEDIMDEHLKAKKSKRSNFKKKIEERKIQNMIEKLQALGSVDSVLLMMKLEGGRVSSNLGLAMKSSEEMFRRTKGCFINNLGLVMSKCDEDRKKDYGMQMQKKSSVYKDIMGEFVKHGIEVPRRECCQIYFLSSLDENLENVSQIDEFERLFQFFDRCKPLGTQTIEDPTLMLQSKIFGIF